MNLVLVFGGDGGGGGAMGGGRGSGGLGTVTIFGTSIAMYLMI